jgi:LacI family transcriptional regulator
MTTVDSDPFENIASVDVDDEGGARAAAEHLIQLGHRDILVVGIERAEHSPSGAEDVVARRMRGYRTAFAAVDVEIADEDVIVSPATFAGGVAALERAWAAGRRPTAVLAMSDAIAIGVIRALRDHNLSIPGDVSIVGFDDIELAQTTDPPLTTVHQPIRGKGEEAARLLLAVIAGTSAPPGHRRLATRLIVRASTGPAPAQQGR